MAVQGATIRERQGNVIRALIAERDILARQLADRPVRVVTLDIAIGRCCYCGQVCHGQACHAHTDLLGIDPAYTEPAA